MKFLWHLYDMMYMYTCVCVQFYKKIRCAYVRVSVYLNIFFKNLKVGNDPNNIVSIHMIRVYNYTPMRADRYCGLVPCTQHGLYSRYTALGYPSESKCEILLVLFTYYLKMRISTHTCQ